MSTKALVSALNAQRESTQCCKDEWEGNSGAKIPPVAKSHGLKWNALGTQNARCWLRVGKR